MEEILKIFTIPDNTTMEEHSIVVEGGAIIGNHSDLGFGVIASSVIAGERVKINGNVIGKEEVRIDMWSQVSGDVRTKNNAYIGEFVNIEGRLVVKGDMDIGKEVKIGGGFEAKGMIVVRSPVPVIIYIFLYLTELIRMGKDEEVEKAMDDLFSDESEDLDTDKLLMIPGGSKINLDIIRVPDKAVIGSNCTMMGNIRATEIIMGNNNTLFGSIKTIRDISIGEGNSIHGNLVTRGEVRVEKNTHILGEINGDRIIIHEQARVDGAIRAANDVIITRDEIYEESKAIDLPDTVPEISKPEKSKVTINKEKSKEKQKAEKSTKKKSAEKKSTEKKLTKKKSTEKKSAKKKSTEKKSTEKKSTEKKSTEKKSTEKKSAKKKSTKKKSTEKKSTEKKLTKKKLTKKKSTKK